MLSAGVGPLCFAFFGKQAMSGIAVKNCAFFLERRSNAGKGIAFRLHIFNAAKNRQTVAMSSQTALRYPATARILRQFLQNHSIFINLQIQKRNQYHQPMTMMDF